VGVALDDDAPKKVDGPSADRRAAQRALEPFNDWVGTWRGVGQPRRGSTKGAWTEKAEWAWKIDRESAVIAVKVEKGKLITEGVLAYDPGAKRFQFKSQSPEGESRTYVGSSAEDGKLVLTTAAVESETQHRLTFQIRHGDRLLLLVETRAAGQTSFSRVAEIGYTRDGGSFASQADAGPKCIVTGGRGTMTVSYKGKTYYVCCTGCKQAFDDDPEAIIAEAADRKKKEAETKKK
jgi:YHS domain-containing protein